MGSRGGTSGSGKKETTRRQLLDDLVTGLPEAGIWGGGYWRGLGGGGVVVTYALVLVTLDNGEVPGVGGALHDEPADGLLVVGVDAAGLDQLGLEPVDRLGVVVGVQVDGDSVDHLGRLSCFVLGFFFFFVCDGT